MTTTEYWSHPMLPPPLLLVHQVALIPLSLENLQITRLPQLSTGQSLMPLLQLLLVHRGTDIILIREPPNPTVTTTEYWSESYATTTTITAPPGATDSVESENHQITQ